MEIESRLAGVKAHVVACGHTHIARAVRSRSGQLLCNPGSVGLPAYDDSHPVNHLVESGSPDARYAIIERRNVAWHACLYTVPYDYEMVARLAETRNRHDQVALRSQHRQHGPAHCVGGARYPV